MSVPDGERRGPGAAWRQGAGDRVFPGDRRTGAGERVGERFSQKKRGGREGQTGWFLGLIVKKTTTSGDVIV